MTQNGLSSVKNEIQIFSEIGHDILISK